MATRTAIAKETPGVGTVYAARTPGTVGDLEDRLSPSPDIGQHSRDVLRDNGYPDTEINALCGAGAVRG